MNRHSAFATLGAIVGALLGIALISGGSMDALSMTTVIGVVLGAAIGGFIGGLIANPGPGTIKHPQGTVKDPKPDPDCEPEPDPDADPKPGDPPKTVKDPPKTIKDPPKTIKDPPKTVKNPADDSE